MRQQYPARIRNELKQKWSYQNILQSLAKTREEYKTLWGTFSTYSLTSHFIHYDWTGVSMRQVQILDAPNQSAVVFDIAHAVRIISNVLSFYIFRVTEYLRGNQHNSPAVVELIIGTIGFLTDLEEVGNLLIKNNARDLLSSSVTLPSVNDKQTM